MDPGVPVDERAVAVECRPPLHRASLVCGRDRDPSADEEDWPAVEEIYAEGIATRLATFETARTDLRRSSTPSHLPDHRLVAVDDGRVVGWATLSPTSSRVLRRGRRELVYIADARAAAASVARSWRRCVASAAAGGIWTIQAGMFPENAASLALHERLGFRLVGRFERIAQLDGVWRDTVLLELRL